eukprot:5160135-Amphidinium_carterae.1
MDELQVLVIDGLGLQQQIVTQMKVNPTTVRRKINLTDEELQELETNVFPCDTLLYHAAQQFMSQL